MSLRRRNVFVTTVVSIWLFAAQIGTAQSVALLADQAGQASPPPDSLVAGIADGEALAKRVGTGGKRALGLPTFIFPPTVALVFVIGPEPLNAEMRQQSVGKSPEYQEGLVKGWSDTTKSRKRSAFLQGTAIGAGAFLGALLWAASGAAGS